MSDDEPECEWEEVTPLVFSRLSVHWNELKLVQPFPFEWHESKTMKLRSFPVPGSSANQDVGAIEVHPVGLTFPGYGAYRLVGPFGAVKLLLLDPTSDHDKQIQAISSFVAAAAYHSGADTHLCYIGSERYPVYPLPAIRKLFYSDQPLALWCGHIVDVLAFLLHSRGYACRKVSLRNSTNVGHIFLEVYFPVSKRWIMVDPDFGVMLTHNGAFLSAQDVVQLRAESKGSQIELLALAEKPLSSHETNYPLSFTGQFTWTQDYLTNKQVNPYYHRVVIDRGFMDVRYHAYTFTHTASTVIRPAVRTRPLELEPGSEG